VGVFGKLTFLAYFWRIFANFAAIKKTFPKNLNACIILVLNVLRLLRSSDMAGEKTATHPATASMNLNAKQQEINLYYYYYYIYFDPR